MPALRGNDFVLRIRTASSPSDVFAEVAANTGLSASINGAEVNVTTKDEAGWRELLDGGGEKTVSISGEGIYQATPEHKLVQGLAMSGGLEKFQVDDGDQVLEGFFQVLTFEQTGDLNEGQTYSVTIESSGQPALTDVV